MTLFACMIAAISFTVAGWYARGLWDLAKQMDEPDAIRYRKD